LDRDVATLWPGAVDGGDNGGSGGGGGGSGGNGDGGFRWSLLCGGPGEASGPERLDSQYWRANIDPSDRYVQSLPGTDQFRLAPGRSGFDNLVVAGDWTDNGLNAGCVEGATRSGQLAAEAVIALLSGGPVAGPQAAGAQVAGAQVASAQVAGAQVAGGA
jgi:hypothetical protein